MHICNFLRCNYSVVFSYFDYSCALNAHIVGGYVRLINCQYYYYYYYYCPHSSQFCIILWINVSADQELRRPYNTPA